MAPVTPSAPSPLGLGRVRGGGEGYQLGREGGCQKVWRRGEGCRLSDGSQGQIGATGKEAYRKLWTL